MIENIKRYLDGYDSETIKLHRLREFLQLIILEILYLSGYFKNISFFGGTALKILYQIRRYSEDLDFSMVQRGSYCFDELVKKIIRELELRNFRVDIKMKKKNNAVRSCFFRFEGLLYELGLSPLKDQKIAIKFEVDENPPQGFTTELSMITDKFTLAINHFNQSSLFAGKLHAILSRQYTKGRDYFDLLWFIGSGVQPNLQFLENALEQSSGKKISLDIKLIKTMLQEKIKETNFEEVIQDLGPFIMDKPSLKLYNQETFAGVVERQM